MIDRWNEFQMMGFEYIKIWGGRYVHSLVCIPYELGRYPFCCLFAAYQHYTKALKIYQISLEAQQKMLYRKFG